MIVTTGFQYIQEADDVAINVCIRVFQRILHSGLSGQITNFIKFFSGKQVKEALAFFQFHSHKAVIWVFQALNK